MDRNDKSVLLVDDETKTLTSCNALLRGAGIKNVIKIDDSRQILPLLAEKEPAVIVLDLYMPHINGIDLLPKVCHMCPETPVIVMTAADEVDTAVNCMKAGAFDYLVKPVDKSRFITSVRNALDFHALKNEVSSLKHYLLTDALQHEEIFDSIITQSDNMKAIFKYAEAIAPSGQPILITGDTGVGKELIANALHALSQKEGEFTIVNIAGLDDAVFSDTLFGHAKGAFTGADQARPGLIAKASGGTLFLDEIGDLDESSQVKMLRLLQERTYYPLGSDSLRESDARIIVATNKTINELKGSGNFRKDLYYRLRTHHIHIPPLKDRSADIPLLLNHFLKEVAQSMGKKKPTVPSELSILLSSYSFPGNVRELRAMVYDAVARCQSGKLSMGCFKDIIESERISTSLPILSENMEKSKGLIETFGRLPTLKEAEEALIEESLKIAKGNQGVAASILGITRLTLNKRLTRKKQKQQNQG